MNPLAGLRIGFGYDAHRCDPDRPLFLGGIRIEDCVGLAGHSDADVLTHAIIDAILSASGTGDIGSRFPDSDPQYKGIPGLELLRRAMPSGWTILQIDATVVCDRPKIRAHRDAMIAALRTVLGDSPAISLKGKTSEGIGALGRGEGIVAFAVALLCRDASL